MGCGKRSSEKQNSVANDFDRTGAITSGENDSMVMEKRYLRQQGHGAKQDVLLKLLHIAFVGERYLATGSNSGV